MSNETRVFGYIEIPTWEGSKKEKVDELNWSAINELPDEGEWPWLIKGMFSQAPERVSYRGHLIHFAASIKGVDEEWANWLGKFEMLLKNMYWRTVELRLLTEYSGDHEYSWMAEFTGEIEPVKKWKFFGECRNFNHVYGKS
jgi:hypothetical protein